LHQFSQQALQGNSKSLCNAFFVFRATYETGIKEIIFSKQNTISYSFLFYELENEALWPKTDNGFIWPKTVIFWISLVQIYEMISQISFYRPKLNFILFRSIPRVFTAWNTKNCLRLYCTHAQLCNCRC